MSYVKITPGTSFPPIFPYLEILSSLKHSIHLSLSLSLHSSSLLLFSFFSLGGFSIPSFLLLLLFYEKTHPADHLMHARRYISMLSCSLFLLSSTKFCFLLKSLYVSILFGNPLWSLFVFFGSYGDYLCSQRSGLRPDSCFSGISV